MKNNIATITYAAPNMSEICISELAFVCTSSDNSTDLNIDPFVEYDL